LLSSLLGRRLADCVTIKYHSQELLNVFKFDRVIKVCFSCKKKVMQFDKYSDECQDALKTLNDKKNYMPLLQDDRQ